MSTSSLSQAAPNFKLIIKDRKNCFPNRSFKCLKNFFDCLAFEVVAEKQLRFYFYLNCELSSLKKCKGSEFLNFLMEKMLSSVCGNLFQVHLDDQN